MKTGINATKLAIAAFIVPYVFAYSPSMLFVDVESWVDIVTICLSAMLGIYGVAAGLNGFVKRKLNWLFRVLFIVGGLTLFLFFQRRIHIVPIRFLRQPDRELPAKPRQAEQASLFPTAIDLSAGKTVANGTDKSVPYKGAP